MISSTRVYEDAYNIPVKAYKGKQEIEFSKEGTITEGYRNKTNKNRVAILNFADALTPGGLVCQGEVTQEEDICRCTNLYESLVLPCCLNDYYYYNAGSSNLVFSNRLIYSRDVLLFRNDSTYTLIDTPKYIDVITCPSPISKVDDSVFCKRIECILNSAKTNGVDTIILGAWGCGAFGQDAVKVGRCFAKVLKKKNLFKKVVFAIKSVVEVTDKGNYSKFRSGFEKEYYN